mgnify:CR=1 FL=1|tara:strand:+ start:739 stop:2004 length:1266 start_codon:yes stop_codon:yes gene_type:complete
MANFTASGMGGPLQPRPPAPAQGAPMNIAVSAEKRSKLKSYMEGYKDAIASKTAEQLLPNITSMSAPAALPPMQPPMQQPMSQPPMMMNMGGMVDVFDPSFMDNLGSEIMDSNENSIIQGFSNGGFTTNLKVAEPERAKQIEDDYVENLLSEYDEMYSPSQPASDNSGSNLAVDQLADAALNFAENNNPLSSPLNVFPPEDDSMPLDLASSGDFQGSGNFNPNYDNTFVNIDDATEELSNMGKFERGLANIFGGVFGKARDDAGNITPLGYADLLAQTRSTAARNQELEDFRRKDQESAERKLAEEQRMRAMIQSMMPPAVDTTTPIDPIIDLPPSGDDTTPTAPTSPIVESTRTPGFDLANLPAFPQFNMPTQPMLPPIIQPDFFKELLANMKMPVATMQEGGNVSSLDNALDNFISTIT